MASGRLYCPCYFLGMVMRSAPARRRLGALLRPGSSDTDAKAVVQSYDEIVIFESETIQYCRCLPSTLTYLQYLLPRFDSGFVRWISPWLSLGRMKNKMVTTLLVRAASQERGLRESGCVGSPSLAEQRRSHPCGAPPTAARTHPVSWFSPLFCGLYPLPLVRTLPSP